MTLKRKQIDIIIKNTPQELKGKYADIIDKLGVYNNGYSDDLIAGYIEYKSTKILVVEGNYCIQ